MKLNVGLWVNGLHGHSITLCLASAFTLPQSLCKPETRFSISKELYILSVGCMKPELIPQTEQMHNLTELFPGARITQVEEKFPKHVLDYKEIRYVFTARIS